MKNVISWLSAAALASAALTASPTHAQTAACNFDAHAAAVAGLGRDGNFVVLAHRGLWGSFKGSDGSPENSRGSLEAARDSCLDGMELDVKLTKDNVPVLMHDFNLGRTTNVYTTTNPAQTKYNPANNTGYNPTVASLSSSQVFNLRLLDNRNRANISGYFVPSVAEAIDYWSLHATGAIVFDVKDALTMQKVIGAAESTLGSGMATLGKGLFYKLNATIFPTYAAYLSAVGGTSRITPIPVYTPNMLVQINVQSSYVDWAKHVHHIEIDMKTENGLLNDIWNTAQHTAGMKIGVFNAIPDANRATGQFYNNTGSCCYTLNDKLVVSSTLRDSSDQRGSFGYVADNFDIITTDDPYGFLGTL